MYQNSLPSLGLIIRSTKFGTFLCERSNRNRETYYSAHVLHIELESRHLGFSTQYMGDDDDTFDAAG